MRIDEVERKSFLAAQLIGGAIGILLTVALFPAPSLKEKTS